MKKLKALIIDDERHARIAISKLGHWSFFGIEKPAEASDGIDGLRAMQELHPDIVCIDMEMPGLNGLNFLEKASAEYPDTKFIIVSGYDQFQYAKAGIKYGAVDYILKPVEEDELNKAIEKAMKLLNPNPESSDSIESPPKAGPADICAVIHDYIETHYHEALSLTAFAQQYHFSKEYLSRLFKNRYKIGFHEYILQVKMKRASELLTDTDVQIQEIALRIGYTDNNYFSKVFRGYYGCTPSEYRQNNLDIKPS